MRLPFAADFPDCTFPQTNPYQHGYYLFPPSALGALGNANVQINRASDGYVLFSAGNYTFSATVTDSEQTGATGKQFRLIVYDPSAVPYHSVPQGTPLQGGNVVVCGQ